MKIGILTYFEGANFGMNLQVYASSKYFETQGHEVWVINYSKDNEECDYSYCNPRQVEAHKLFIATRLNLTKRLSQVELLSFIKNNKFDVIAFGADAIWNKRDRTNLFVYTAQWLNGEDEVKKRLRIIGLSPAFMGTNYSDLREAERESFRRGIMNFTFPNVRDNMTKQVVNRDIMRENYITRLNPDPVFLLCGLCEDKWEVNTNDILPKSYYVVTLPTSIGENPAMQRWLMKLKNEVNNRGYKLVELPLPEGTSHSSLFDYTVQYPIDPLQWFLWLKNAKAFIGLRFHAVVSCISSLTPFYSLDIYGRIPRWLYYLNRFGLHKYDRVLNKSSKIRNLIEGSGLESFRMNGFFVNRVNPKRLVEKLENCDTELIRSFRDANVEIFHNNIKEALS